MSTPTVETTHPRCTLCGEGASDSKAMFVAGMAPICHDCDESFRTVIRNHLAPVAESLRAPLDQLMSMIAYEIRDEHWVVHLHTFRPSSVIGARGTTVQPIRDELVQLTGDKSLQLNIADHQGRGCKASST